MFLQSYGYPHILVPKKFQMIDEVLLCIYSCLCQPIHSFAELCIDIYIADFYGGDIFRSINLETCFNEYTFFSIFQWCVEVEPFDIHVHVSYFGVINYSVTVYLECGQVQFWNDYNLMIQVQCMTFPLGSWVSYFSGNPHA